MSTTGHRAPKAPVGQHWAWRPTSEVERNHQWEVLAPGDRAQPCRWGTAGVLYTCVLVPDVGEAA